MLGNLHGGTGLANRWSGGENHHIPTPHSKDQKIIHRNQSCTDTNLGLSPHGGLNVI